MTTGAPQSNHARLTAAAAARAGMASVLVFPGDAATAAGHSGNVALDGLFGARVAWAGDVGHDELARTAETVVAQLRTQGARPALIPFGGSSALGARGYLEGGRELFGQAPDLHTVVVALGSGGTMAGLIAALGSDAVLGVHTGALDDPAPVVAELAGQISDTAVITEQLRLRLDQVGAGYSQLTAQTAEAILLAARTEGIVLDPVYTGRAMAGLAAAVADGTLQPGRKIVFLHTGGLPGLFGHPSAVAFAESSLATHPIE